MKLSFFALCLLLFSANIYSQNDAAERIALSSKMLATEYSQDELSRIGIKWNQFLNKYGNYPDLPLDSNGHVRYSNSHEFSQETKEKLFNHTLEWLAINYGIYPANIYSNLADGKIILNNSFNIDGTYSCSYTCIFSFKDEKMLVEFFNINYQGFFQGHNSGDSWIPEKTVNFNINQVFPVILKDSSEWKFNLNLLKAANEHFKSNIINLWDYLTNYESYNSF